MRSLIALTIALATILPSLSSLGRPLAVSPDNTLRSKDSHYRDSIADLGYRLYFGDSTLEAQPVRAMLLIAEASHLGDPRADNNLAFILLNGDSTFRDPQRALSLFRRAADTGLPTAMAQLADLYRSGTVCPPDTDAASKLYLDAAARGLRDAEIKLIAMCRPKWIRTAPDSLLHFAQSIYPRIAPTAAVEMLRIVADTPDSISSTDSIPPSATALAILGDAKARGLGTPYDYSQSLLLFFRAARLGDPSAQFIIAETLDLTPDVLIPIASALQQPLSDEELTPGYWYERAAAHGITDAKNAYARLLPTVRQPH